MGTSSSGLSGQTCDHIRLATFPWSLLTPLRYWAMRIPRTNMETGSSGPAPSGCPHDRILSAVVPSFSSKGTRYGFTSSAGNSSWPAATGVWVVKTVVLGTISRAVFRSTWWDDMVKASRSRLANAQWPSFIWHTVGLIPMAVRALIPPIPRSISCARRILCPPAYNFEVISRISGGLSGRSVSRRYRGMWPTINFQTTALISSSGPVMDICTSFPKGSFALSTGRL